MTITIESSTPLSSAQQQALIHKLQTIYPHVSVDFHLSPLLIGGLRFTTPHRVLDLSLKARLNQLSSQLLKP